MASHTLMINLSSSSSLISSKTHLNKFHTTPAFSFSKSCFFVTHNNKPIRKLLFVRAMGSSPSSQNPEKTQDVGQSDYSSLPEGEWKKRLTPEQFYVCRQKGTERAFTGEYWNTKAQGTYHCVCCDTPLFESSTKFDSGTGWPSYYKPIGNNVKSKLDLSVIFMPRQETICAVCNAHLGHVFGDGPPPTGKRFCINSVSLKLKTKNDA